MTSSRSKIECPECSAENAPSSRFCDSCGVSLAHVESSPAESRKQRDPERAEKIMIERKLVKARKVLKSVRLMYGILAIPAILQAIVFASSLQDSPGPASGAESINFMLALGTALLMVAGVAFLYLQPLFWTCVIACIDSLNMVMIFTGDGGLHPFRFAVTIFLWSAVGLMLNITRLQKDYPDFLTNDKLKRRKRREGTDVSEARNRAEDRDRERRSARNRSLAIFGGIVLVVIFGVSLFSGDSKSSTVKAGQSNARPEPSKAEKAVMEEELTAQLSAFKLAYGEVDLEGMKAMFMPEKREYYFPRIVRVIEKRGWIDELPTLRDEDHYRDSSYKQRIYFELPKGQLKTLWMFIDEGWRIQKFTFSKTR